MKLLVSVRSAAEALDAAEAGADFIDLKEPRAGALGALPLDTVREVVAVLRARYPGCHISATVGDFAAEEVEPVVDRARATAACGVDYVKVGIAPGATGLLSALAELDAAIVPVFIVDEGLDDTLLAQAGALPFPAVMLDTAHKTRGSLFDAVPEHRLRDFVEAARARCQLSGLAGALRAEHVPALQALSPDFAGFRSAVCAGTRTGALDAGRVRDLCLRVHSHDTVAAPGPV